MTDRVVVNARLALRWVLSEADSATAITLLQRWNTSNMAMIAPALFTYEVTNILYRQVVTNKLSYEEVKKLLTKLLSIGILLNFAQHIEISVRAMELSHRFGLLPHMMPITWHLQSTRNVNTGLLTYVCVMLLE